MIVGVHRDVVSWAAECRSPQPAATNLSRDAVVRAHQVMQRHRACRVGSCREKSAAFDLLVSLGRIVPDSHRTFQG
ncbi:hypothetical protein JK358_35755 [Nocardia sp. 2]|uniref:Uncharacterized protein n=1 Tax=Nocardia acididurans TaxID=2802282 RepID=A0ABS1MGI1_9NOCA|nr:hypothetical protein [Nocardia acididurans]MBL1079771.1 hypothetical protein [Nocardia acididurans]